MTQFHTLHQFWQMGGYGAYVWSSYAIVMAALFGRSILLMRKSRKIKSKIL